MELAKPFFEMILGSPLDGAYTFRTLLTLFAIASVTGILSGVYPAMVITSLQPIHILRGHLSKGPSGKSVRKILVVVQYSATVMLLIAILTVYRQLEFIHNRDLGFTRENLVVIELNGSPEAMPGYSSFYNQMKSLGSMKSIARSNTMIGEGLSKESAVGGNSSGDNQDITVGTVGIDHDYMDTWGIELKAGRNFIRGSASDSTAFIINEAATLALGFTAPRNVIGKHFSMRGFSGEVVGVVKDFHHASLHEPIGPLAMFLLPGSYSRISIRMTGDQRQNMEWIEGAWKKSFPHTVFDYFFVDDRLHNSYRSENRFANFSLVFSTLSIIIASLGLFALVSYTVERRTKEIGVRKVFGANVIQVAALLSNEFLVLVVISCALSIPLGWYMMEEWLQSFAYRINLGAPEVIGAGLFTLALALITLCIRTVQAALANPAESLKAE
jgi:putative ABC transport system permease protein